MAASKDSPFSSLRIIGKKAQKLIERAKLLRSEQPAASRAPKKTAMVEVVPIAVTTASVVKATFAVLAVIVGLWILFYVRDKLVLMLLAIFVATVIDPGVQALERWGVPRGIAILLHYFIALFLITFLVVSLIPIIAQQLQQIAIILKNAVNEFIANPQFSLPYLSPDMNRELSRTVAAALEAASINQFADAVAQLAQSISGAASQSFGWLISLAGSVVSTVVTLIVVLVLAFFMQLEKERVKAWVLSFFPRTTRTYVHEKVDAIHSKIGQWARGQLLLCAAIFLLTLVPLLIIQMPYALTLAVLAGFCELIPAVGPFFAAVPAVLIGFTSGGPLLGLALVGMYYAIQWCENNLLVPLVMRRAVGLSPIAILFAMLIGISFPETIHPIIGVMLAIPTTTIITLFLEDLRQWER